MAVLAIAACSLLPATAGAATIGTTTVFSDYSHNTAGVAQDYRFTASASASVDRLNVYLDRANTAARVEIGVYSGIADSATALLAKCAISSPQRDAWNRCTIPAVTLTQGASYWLAVLQPRRVSGYLAYSEGAVTGAPRTYLARGKLTSLPSTWTNGGASWAGYQASIYADQASESAPPPPPADSDGDGVPDSSDQCPGTPPGTPVDATGCPTQPPPSDTTAPDTTITDHPVDGTATSASFSFASSESNSTFTCALDGAAMASCVSPKAYTGLSVGQHTFKVAATDQAGNADQSPASFTWTISAPAMSGPCASSKPNTPDGSDPWGGCFPGPSNTGVPDGTNLTAYTGSCNVTVANTVIDGKTVTCDIQVRAGGLVIKNSLIKGAVHGFGPAFRIQDTTIDGHDANGFACINCGVDGPNSTVLRTEITGTNRGVFCESICDVEDTWIHGTDLQPVVTNLAHASALRLQQNSNVVHNSLWCSFAGPFVNNEIGCSADVTGYPDFTPINHNTVVRNLLVANSVGNAWCAYGGGTQGKPYSNDPTNATYVVFRDNIFQRGTNGKCGAYGPITDFMTGRTGNVWQNNRWDTGELVPAG